MKNVILLLALAVHAASSFANNTNAELLQKIRDRKADVLAQSFVATETFLLNQGFRANAPSVWVNEQSEGLSQGFAKVTVLAHYSKDTDVDTGGVRAPRLTKRESVSITIECVSAKSQTQETATCDVIREIRQRSETSFIGGTGFSSSSGS